MSRRRTSSRPPRQTRTFYHGGVPGLNAGDEIVPAVAVTADLDYCYPSVGMAPLYDPGSVYVTTHLGTARGFAARYFDLRSPGHCPGDVYEVVTIGKAHIDQDFSASAPLEPISFVAPRATIVAVVERGVSMTLSQQRQAEYPHLYWTDSTPVYDENGIVIPSTQMLGYGVTAEYMALVSPWTDIYRSIGADGRIYMVDDVDPGIPRRPITASEAFDFFPILGAPTHAVQRTSLGYLECCCGGVPIDRSHAAKHALGGTRVVGLIQRFNPQLSVSALLRAARVRDPGRWDWLDATG